MKKIMKKKSQSALFSPPGRWTGNTFLFKGGLANMWDFHVAALYRFDSLRCLPNHFSLP